MKDELYVIVVTDGEKVKFVGRKHLSNNRAVLMDSDQAQIIVERFNTHADGLAVALPWRV